MYESHGVHCKNMVWGSQSLLLDPTKIPNAAATIWIQPTTPTVAYKLDDNGYNSHRLQIGQGMRVEGMKGGEMMW